MASQLFAELRDLEQLPSIPGVALQIIDLIQSEDVSVPQLSDVLARDPALVAKLLRTANSSMFGLAREVTSINTAISLLGMRTVNLLALSFSLVPQSSSGAFDQKRFWRFSATTTTAARFLAREVAPELLDECFLAGILCRLGQLVLAQGMPARYAVVMERLADPEETRPLWEVEREVLGESHLEVGAAVLDAWGLPPRVCMAVGAYDEPDALERGSKERELAQILRLTALCAELCFGNDFERAVVGIKQMAAEFFNLDGSWCAELIAHIQQELPRAAALFEVELDDPTAINETCMRASQLMVKETLALNQQVQTATAQAAQLAERATRDALTGLGNRGFFDETLEAMLEAAVRAEAPLGLVLVDLDHFKSVNDDHGHAIGDELLRAVGSALAENLPADAGAFRYGGEEFAVLLPGGTAATALAFTESLRERVEALEIPTDRGPLSRTASFGLCWLERVEHVDVSRKLIETADRALYSAKREGRNRVVVAEGL